MLKPVAAVGGALALAGAGAIGSISLMENFVIAGIKDVAACDENPVGQVGPFKSTLDFGCTVDSEVKLSSGATVNDTYAAFAKDKLESVPTSEFWPLFPVRNYFGLKPTIEKKVQDGLASLAQNGLSLSTEDQILAKYVELFVKSLSGAITPAEQALLEGLEEIIGGKTILATEFESCQTAYETPVEALGNQSFGVAVLFGAVGENFDDQFDDQSDKINEGLDKLTQLPNFFEKNQTQPEGVKAFCQSLAGQLEAVTGFPAGSFRANCDDVIDFVKPTEELLDDPKVFAFVNGQRTAANANAKSLLEVVKGWKDSILAKSPNADTALLDGLLDAKKLGDLCQGAVYESLPGLVQSGKGYADLSISPAVCKNLPLAQIIFAQVTKAVVGGITGVDRVTDLTDPDQVKRLVEKCEDQEKDLAAIEQAQILLPGGAAAAGLAALLLFVAVATAKAPLVLAGGFLGVVGGVVTLVALLGVKNAPVYANVGGNVKPGEVEYKQGLGATLGLVGIGAPVIGGLLGVGSFFCGSDEGGNELSSKVDNTY